LVARPAWHDATAPTSHPVLLIACYGVCVSTQIEEPSDDQVATAVETLKLLADPTRLRILWALLHGEHSVGHLADHVGAPAPAVSQHLAKLRLARLVQTRRDGNHIFYLADDDHVGRLLAEALFHAGSGGKQKEGRSA
jgi:DNA-binding transcriptional ArsR family regulator